MASIHGEASGPMKSIDLAPDGPIHSLGGLARRNISRMEMILDLELDLG